MLSSYGGGSDVLFAKSFFGIRFVAMTTLDRDFKILFKASKTSKTIQSNIPKIVAKLMPRTRPAAPPTSDKYCSHAGFKIIPVILPEIVPVILVMGFDKNDWTYDSRPAQCAQFHFGLV